MVSERLHVMLCLGVAAALFVGKTIANGVSGVLSAVGVPAAQVSAANALVFAVALAVVAVFGWRRLPGVVRRHESRDRHR